jgi:fructose-specific phosphotransferase system IIC component
MFGQVLGGYYMAKAAILANKMQEVTNEEYYLNKVTISKFYISQLLPLASGYISSSIADSKELFSIKSENI